MELKTTKVYGDLSVSGRIINNDPWHDVVFANGWTNYGFEWATAGFFKTPDGIVYLKGLIKSGTFSNTSDGSGIGRIFTLPPGYRPSEKHLFANISYGSDYALGRVNVHTNGNVEAVQGGNAWFSLERTFFKAAV